MLSFVILLVCAGVIYLACEYFVNGVEWAACRMNVGATATGTLLAAFGTALPESAITLMAVAFGASPESKSIGVGAALGGPLVLATVSYAVVGIMLLCCAKKLKRADTHVQVNQKRLSEDQLWFFVIFAFKVLLGLVIFTGKAWMGVLFLLAYALYIRKEMRHADEVCEVLEPLKLRPNMAAPTTPWIALQTLGAMIVIGFASHFFVAELESAGEILGLSPQLVALLFSPLATELPETMNAIIWLRQGKENLALANISGAMMIQATVPSALGLFFTSWHFDPPLILAGGLTMLAIAIMFAMFRRGKVAGRGLASVGLLYVAFVIGLIVMNVA